MASQPVVYVYLRREPAGAVMLGGIGRPASDPTGVVHAYITEDRAEARRWAAELAAGRAP